MAVTVFCVEVEDSNNVPVVVDNTRINSQLLAYLASHGVKLNDTDPTRWAGGWAEPGPGQGPGRPVGPNPTGPGSPLATVVIATIQTLNLFIPVLNTFCSSLQSCAGLVGPEAYLGRFWSTFLSSQHNPIQAFKTTLETAIGELVAYAQSNGIPVLAPSSYFM